MMKNLIIPALTLLAIVSCKTKTTAVATTDEAADEVVYNGKYQVYGENFSPEGAISKEEMLAKYQNLGLNDTLNVKFKTTILDVCQKKGCWMTLDLGAENQNFVKFTDYAFFVPKDAMQDEVIVNGKAYIHEETVERQKHYAKDGGQSQAEIDKITKPKKTMYFMADGVLIARN